MAKVPMFFTAWAITGVLGATCFDQSCDVSPEKSSEGAALLQSRHHRSHVHKYPVQQAQPDSAPSEQIFQDVPGEGCRVGSSCAAGGIPESRGACVQASSTIECWDICNAAHEPEDYTTGDPDRDLKLAEAVTGVRAGDYAHMRCPTSSSLDGQETPASDASASDDPEMLTVMDSVQEAEQAAERARLLTAAAERESAALGNDSEGSKEAAEVMKVAAAAEAEAAEKARRASRALKRLSKQRTAQATSAEAEYGQEQEPDGAKEDAQAAAEYADAQQAAVAAPTDIAVAPTDPEEPLQGGLDPTFDDASNATSSGSGAMENSDSASDATSGDEPLLGSGCCFSFGYAAMMEPCCLSSVQVTNRSFCEEQGNVTGGQRSFTFGQCPTTAREAETIVMGTAVSEAAHSVDNVTIGPDTSDPTVDNSMVLGKMVEAVNASFEKANADAISANTIAIAKLATAKNMEALAIAAKRDAKSAAATPDEKAEKGEQAQAEALNKKAGDNAEQAQAQAEAFNKEAVTTEKNMEALAIASKRDARSAAAKVSFRQDPEASARLETLAKKADLEAKIANTEAKRALSNASDADLVVKRHVQWQRLVDAQNASKKVSDIKKEIARFEAAIEQLRGFPRNIVNQTDETDRNLQAALSVRRLKLKEALEQEKAAKKALQIAQDEAAAAALAAEVARALVEKAQIEEEQARNGLSDEDKEGANDNKDSATGCQWRPVDPCLQTFTYKGETILGCTDKDRYVPWCSHDANFTTGSANWSTCTYSCSDGNNTNEPDSGSLPAEDGCAEDPDGIVRPCSRGNLTRWGIGKQTEMAKQSEEEKAPTRRCGWKPTSGCVPSFKYKETMYTGCTDDPGEAVGWCSLDTDYKGRWEKCSYVCEGDQTSSDWSEPSSVEEESTAEGEMNPAVEGASTESSAESSTENSAESSAESSVEGEKRPAVEEEMPSAEALAEKKRTAA